MSLLHVYLERETGNFLFEGAICVKKNLRVRDPGPTAGESTVLGVNEIMPNDLNDLVEESNQFQTSEAF